VTLVSMTPLSIVSRKDLIAIITLVDVAIHGRDQPVRTRDIAARHHSGARYFEPMLQVLAGCGLVESKRGKKGGYRLAGDPRLISVADVVRAMRGAEEEVGRRRAESQSTMERLVSETLEAAVDGLSESNLNITIHDLVQSAESLSARDGKGRRSR